MVMEVSSATQIANLAYRSNAEQLLERAIHFLAAHLVCVRSTGSVADIEPAVADLVWHRVAACTMGVPTLWTQ